MHISTDLTATPKDIVKKLFIKKLHNLYTQYSFLYHTL